MSTPARPHLGLIGLGAFGAFCRPHLERIGTVHGHDPAQPGSAPLAEAASQPVVILAVPVARLAEAARAIAPHLRPGALVVEVCSIKTHPLAVLRDLLPAHVELLGTHPLFGPQSGRDGIAGLRLVACPGGGAQARLALRMLRRLGLQVVAMTAEEHDRQMAWVQGLTHLVARLVAGLEMPALPHTTPSFDLLMRATAQVSQDSEALFRTITEDNPFVAGVKAQLLAGAERLLAPMPAGEAKAQAA
ncbi:prephenate dehydrogenase/arogenate dehydrogenase family protein [Roseomonas sp. GC11]|uniref:prephenate dehydrogenase/arogenate dehydrogenase family protein n=1 Tax=Roseomonas sp. GC11 TaxID=2950546 RepID=UPI002108D7ED|nr:prephenate dehydrogenase/arogenate dehydrogenase family protein [Roseomonas sp. GC11]MCQ4160563.1 prephenate dehydrogenase/arogenate dehydrogenase family protein [Roseomonas sp. GC11]